MKILIVVGMPASGKNIARQVAEAKGIPYFATGDLVRAEVKRRGAIGPEQTACISTELRGRDGMGVTRLALEAALGCGKEIAFMEGMRSWPEIELIRKKAEAVVIAFLGPRDLRKERVVARGRDDDSAASFAARDWREIEYGAAVPVALADEYLLNTGSLGDAERVLVGILARHAQ
jgi:dephospho-CoA kinase